MQSSKKEPKELRTSKRAQLGSTATWLVATVIIFVILLIFYFASSTLVAEQTLKIKTKRFAGLSGFTEEDNLLTTKTSIAYLLTEKSKRKKVDAWLKDKGINLGEYIDE